MERIEVLAARQAPPDSGGSTMQPSACLAAAALQWKFLVDNAAPLSAYQKCVYAPEARLYLLAWGAFLDHIAAMLQLFEPRLEPVAAEDAVVAASALLLLDPAVVRRHWAAICGAAERPAAGPNVPRHAGRRRSQQTSQRRRGFQHCARQRRQPQTRQRRRARGGAAEQLAVVQGYTALQPDASWPPRELTLPLWGLPAWMQELAGERGSMLLRLEYLTIQACLNSPCAGGIRPFLVQPATARAAAGRGRGCGGGNRKRSGEMAEAALALPAEG